MRVVVTEGRATSAASSRRSCSPTARVVVTTICTRATAMRSRRRPRSRSSTPRPGCVTARCASLAARPSSTWRRTRSSASWPSRRRTIATTSPPGWRCSRDARRRSRSTGVFLDARRSTASRRNSRSRSTTRSSPPILTGPPSWRSNTRYGWYGDAYGLRSSVCAISTPPAPRRARRAARPETHLIPLVLQAAAGVSGGDHLRRRLPDAGRHLHPRLRPRRGPGARPRAGDVRGRAPGSSELQPGVRRDGYSVRQVITAAARVTGRPIKSIRRPAPHGRSSGPRRQLGSNRTRARLATGAPIARRDHRISVGLDGDATGDGAGHASMTASAVPPCDLTTFRFGLDSRRAEAMRPDQRRRSRG